MASIRGRGNWLGPQYCLADWIAAPKMSSGWAFVSRLRDYRTIRTCIDDRVQVHTPDPHPTAYPDRRERSGVNPVSYRLLIEPQQAGDFGHCEEFRVRHGARLSGAKESLSDLQPSQVPGHAGLGRPFNCRAHEGPRLGR
jgi:hypothetical protein